ncbi:HEAT repeat domain-containing protein [Pontibacillus sp. HMF3514]|uniref:HEAT repeat domain-containing protein n=1 Tax=Pontibacillus sp. HMF3514 TaxID=2692425 RepID=UPI0013202604|nr:hypothetical protein [Pontibacillus sp. HMF3514]QHE54081.1 hypothetical protein GS400_19545 [Pontibacillus sp. HMF3514]
MFVNLDMAYWAIYGLLAILGINVFIILAMKIRKKQTQKKTQKCVQQFQEYLDTIQSDLKQKDRLPLPDKPLNKFEKQVLQQVLFDWIHHYSGEKQTKLEILCKDLGLVELNLKRLKSLSHKTQVDAAYNLGVMRAPEATDPLFQLLYRNKRDSTMFIIARSIAQTSDQPAKVKDMIIHLSEDNHNNYALITDISQESSLDLRVIYTQLLKESRPVLTKVALLGLMEESTPDLHSQVLPFITSEDKEVRELTVQLLIYSGACSASEIQKFIRFKDWEIRSFIAEWIGDAKKTEYTSLLEEGLKDKNWTVARSSARSLLKLGESGFEMLCKVAQTNQAGADVALECLHEELSIQASKAEQMKQSSDYDHKLYIFKQHFGEDQQLTPAM